MILSKATFRFNISEGAIKLEMIHQGEMNKKVASRNATQAKSGFVVKSALRCKYGNSFLTLHNSLSFKMKQKRYVN